MPLQLQTPLWVMANATVSAGLQLAACNSHKAMLACTYCRELSPNASAGSKTTVGDAERDCLCRAAACRLQFSQGRAGVHFLLRAVAQCLCSCKHHCG